MSYSVREVSALLGLRPSQIRIYAEKGFLAPGRGPEGELQFGFHDLVLLRTASELSAAKIPQRKVLRALERLREQLPSGRSLTGVRITADGDNVIVRDGGAVWIPESGQSLFDFSVADLEAGTKTLTAPLVHRAAAEEEDQESGAEYWFELACELEMSSIESAKDAYERALAVDPDHSDAHVNLGRLLHEEGATAAAEQHYRAAVEANPEHDTAAFNLAVALEDLGRIDDALDAYAKGHRPRPRQRRRALQPGRHLRAARRQAGGTAAFEGLPELDRIVSAATFWSAVAAATAFVCSARRVAYESGSCGYRTPKRSTRPGSAPVIFPSRRTGLPLTTTCVIPSEKWCGSS
jgi:tetratricopeptide (TPR) repeat protein